MPGISEQFQQSDVRTWGLAALACTGLAVMVANVSSLMPSAALGVLHAPRNEIVSMAQLRQQVAELRTETIQLRRQNETLNARFSLQEQTGGDVLRRVGALEVSLPNMMENQPSAIKVDRSLTTAAIKSPGTEVAAEGGTVLVRQSPMPQPLPAAPKVASAATGAEVGYGVAVGPGFGSGQAAGQWRDLEIRLGSLVSGLAPLVGNGAQEGQQRLVLGPFALQSQARDMCLRLEQVNIACAPTSYSGASLSR